MAQVWPWSLARSPHCAGFHDCYANVDTCGASLRICWTSGLLGRRGQGRIQMIYETVPAKTVRQSRDLATGLGDGQLEHPRRSVRARTLSRTHYPVPRGRLTIIVGPDLSVAEQCACHRANDRRLGPGDTM